MSVKNIECYDLYDNAEEDQDIPSYQTCGTSKKEILLTPPVKLPLLIPSSLLSSVPEKPTYQFNKYNDEYFCSERKPVLNALSDVINFCSAPEPLQRGFDKDASWGSSMESIVEQTSPRKDFNTIEKATFFPSSFVRGAMEMQPRALWPNSSEESLSVRPLDASLDDEYSRETRVSDVCSVFKSLHMALPETHKEENGDPYNFLSMSRPSARPEVVKFLSSPESAEANLVNDELTASDKLNLQIFQTPENMKRYENENKNSPNSTCTPLHCSSPSVFTPEKKSHINEAASSDLNTQIVSDESHFEVTLKNDSEVTIASEKTSDLTCTEVDNYIEPQCCQLIAATANSSQIVDCVQTSQKIEMRFKSSTSPESTAVSSLPKVMYGSCDVMPLTVSEEDLFQNLVELENISNNFLKSVPLVTEKLPENKEFVPFCDLIKDFHGSDESKENPPEKYHLCGNINEIKQNGGESVCQAKSEVERTEEVAESCMLFRLPQPSISTAVKCARKRLRLEVSPWNSTTPVENSQIDVTDTQMFKAGEDVETSLCHTPTLLNGNVRERKRRKVSKKLGFNALDSVEEIEKNSIKRMEYGKKLIGTKGLDDSKTLIPADESVTHHILVEPLKDNCDKDIADALKIDHHMSDKNHEGERENPEQFFGFRTGNNTEVNISEQSLNKVKKMFNDCDKDNSEGDQENSEQFFGFRTGNNTAVDISEQSLNKVQQMLRVCDNDNVGESKKNSEQFVGFQTANNTSVNVSKQSLDKVKEMFSDCDSDGIGDFKKNSNQFVGFRTANNTSVSISKQSVDKVKQMFSDCNNDAISDVKENSEQFVGFKTANNTSVSISKQSLDKVKQMFSDCNKDTIYGDQQNCEQFVGFSHCNNDVDENAQENSEQFVGFKTANNTSVSISKQSLDKVRQMFSDCNNDAIGDVKENSEQIVGFKTANNTSVSISKQSLDKVKQMFSDCNKDTIYGDQQNCEQFVGFSHCNNDVDENAQENSEQFVGFKTANNTSVSISKQSLDKVKQMFSDCNKDTIYGDQQNCEQFVGFSHCNNDVDENAQENSEQIVGFKTANNTSVSISKQSVDKVKQMFSDCNNDAIGDVKENSEQIVGFKTANNTSISISKQSLDKVKEIFSECSNDGTRNIQENSEQFAGFRTGNNTSVSISTQSLDKVKQMFSEKSNIVFENVLRIEEQALLQDGSNIEDISNNLDDPHNRFAGQSYVKSEGVKNPVAINLSANQSGHCSINNVSVDITVKTSESKKNCGPHLADQCSDSVLSFKQKTEKVHNTSTGIRVANDSTNVSADQSDLALLNVDDSILENTNWDDSILPEWVISELNETENVTSGVNKAVKRLCTSPVAAVSKRKRLILDEKGRIILESRRSAREMQIQRLKVRHKVKPIEGAYLRQRQEGRTVQWKSFLPEGPRNFKLEELRVMGVPQTILDVNCENARDFRFSLYEYYSQSEIDGQIDGLEMGDGFKLIPDDDDSAGVAEVEAAFLTGPGVDASLVPAGWILHHYGLIVWKLACYHRSCPSLKTIQLTPHDVMLQLKYRYDREIDRCESSALKRILERDDTAAKAMVLLVMQIKQTMEAYELLLSDGWYTCPARCDAAMSNFIRRGKIRVGTKLMSCGAELVGCDQGVPPLEKPREAYLKISTNSTRRVRWHVKLGFQGPKCRPCVLLRSVLPLGGNIFCIHVIVVRKYPLVFMERTSDGKNITRSARSEQKVAVAFQREQERRIEGLVSQIQRDFAKEASLGNIDGGLVGDSQDLCFLENLSEDTKDRVGRQTEAQRAAANANLEKKLQEVRKGRNVRSVLRMRVVDLSRCDNSAVVSWWQPDEDFVAGFVEGAAYSFYNLTPSAARGQQLYLNSSRMTSVHPLPAAVLNESAPPPLRTVVRVSSIHHDFVPPMSELDVVGLVVSVHGQTDRIMRTVYLSDGDGETFFGLVFWSGLQEYCCEDILAEGLVVGVSNVQWRQSSRSAIIPLGYVNETTLFTHNSKSRQMQAIIEELKQDLEEDDIPSLIERCQDKIETLLFKSTLGDTSLIRQAYERSPGAANLSKTSSPASLINNKGLMPQAASTPVKPRMSATKRLELLERYGDAPLLSPIPINNLGMCKKPFTSPAIRASSVNSSKNSS